MTYILFFRISNIELVQCNFQLQNILHSNVAFFSHLVFIIQEIIICFQFFMFFYIFFNCLSIVFYKFFDIQFYLGEK